MPSIINELPAGRQHASRLPAVVGNLPLRNADFTGRSELLDRLHQRLRTGTTAVLPSAVHGPGGIGKSQLVTEYVYRHQSDFDLIWWVPAEQPTQIRTALTDLAARLALPVPMTANTAVPAALEALRIGRPYANWLLIFDNAENPAEVERFFPRGGPGSIVVTSRNPNWSEMASALPIQVFDRNESVELMRRRDPGLASDDADRLATVLGDLPLAIEAAAAWRAETKMAPDDYLTLLDESRSELGEDSAREELDYPPQVAAVWNISLQGLGRRDPSALRLLQLCAFLAPEPISKQLISKLDPLVFNSDRRDRAIRTIGKLALVRLDHRSGSFQMHRLVQRVLISQMDPATREAMRHGAHLILAGNDPDQPDDPDYWPRYAELYPHLVASQAESCRDDLVRAMIMNEVRYLWRWGEHEEARELARRAYRAWLEWGDESEPGTLRMAYWLGFLHFVIGDYPVAATLNARTLELYRSAEGEDAAETLNAMGAVASDRRVAGDFAGALVLSQTVYERADRAFGADDPFTLNAAHNLAVSMRLSGLFGRALQLDERTYQSKVQIFGNDHPDSLLTAGGINLDRRELGDYVKAHADQEDVVVATRRVLGYDDHPDLLRVNRELARFRRKAGLRREALDLSSDVLRRYRDRYGDQHPETVLAQLTVSIDQRETGDWNAARESGEAALRSLVERYGDGHPHTAGARSDLAVTLRLLGDHQRARDLNEQAVRSLSERLGESHALVLAARINLASDRFGLGEFDEAFALDEENYRQCGKFLGQRHPTTLACGVNLAMDLRGLGRDGEASTLFEATMNAFRTTLGEEHPVTAAAGAGIRVNCDVDPLSL
ncbi:FxSxx-COOH system tetratricopeptide repeat protein [Actinoplanes sp. NPDC051411]|uniref:FxSxx-COOH system tetratricopeptide repeat protein n=1 Tax=Actinoplanes sp. NPDC051411 TaxID=3155522 RepID=UPI0034281563